MKQFFIFVFITINFTSLQAQPGTLDKTFGKQGLVYTNLTGGCLASVIQPDGKLLAAGSDIKLGGLIIRYLQDGRVDSSFGNYGIVVIDLTAEIDGIALQPDGKIVMAGVIFGLKVYSSRLTANGHFDSSFGANGISVIKNFTYTNQVTAVGIQSDGKIVINGTGQDGAESDVYMTLIRLNNDGGIDKGFGESGRVTNYKGASTSALAIQEDNKIVTCGYNLFGPYGEDYIISRYNTDGSYDKTFGDEGSVTTDFFGADDNSGAITLQKDGKIIVGGYSLNETKYPLTGHMTAVRYETNGSIDATFGKEGKMFVPFGNRASSANAVLVQDDGRIILAGGAFADISFDGANYALCRLTKDGDIDSSFAENGRQVNVSDNFDYCRSAVLQKDGEIVLFGEDESNNKFLLARYNGYDPGKQPLAVRIKRWLLHHGISWQVQQNKDVRYYAVQRSADNIVYKEIAKLSNKAQVDKYEDATITGSSYYRLAAIGWDGSRTYSNTILIDDNAQVKVFPNPVRDNLQLQGLQSGKTSVSIVDLQGNVRSSSVAAGSNYSVNTSQLTPGNYLLKLQHNSTTTTQPFVKE